MEQQTFFPSANRRVIIGSPTKQASTKRICVDIRMPLTGEALLGCPEWVSKCYEAVSQYSREMKPEIEQIADLTVAFSNAKPKGKLFDDPDAKIPAAELRNFCIQRCGEEKQPEVELAFKLYAPFSREFWKWLGEMAGAEVYMAFPKSLGGTVAKPDTQLPLGASATETEALKGDKNPPKDAPKKANRGTRGELQLPL